MSSVIINQVWRFIALVLFQVFILNNIQLGGYVNPYLYVLFIILLPLETPRTATLFLGFILGFSVDLFTQTLGMHTAAAIFTAYSRPYVLNLLSPREDYEFGTRPNIADMGFTWFLSYASVLVFLHHLVLFLIEIYRLDELAATLGRALLSTALTVILIIITQYLTFRPGRAS